MLTNDPRPLRVKALSFSDDMFIFPSEFQMTSGEIDQKQGIPLLGTLESGQYFLIISRCLQEKRQEVVQVKFNLTIWGCHIRCNCSLKTKVSGKP